jgi:hypothetical protein
LYSGGGLVALMKSQPHVARGMESMTAKSRESEVCVKDDGCERWLSNGGVNIK